MRALALLSIALTACRGGGLSSESLGKNKLSRSMASLSGYVRSSGASIAGATASLGDSQDTSDASGLFTLTDLPLGAQQLRIVASGFADMTIDVEIVIGSNDMGEIQLRAVAQSCGDIQSDHANCGACGHACASNESCTSGTCETLPYDCIANGCPAQSHCDDAQNTCLAGCLSNDHCPAEKVCDTAKNNCVCGSGTHNCFGVCASDTAVATCGQSCSPCLVPANAVATCNGVGCGFTCNPGFQRCNANACCAVMENVATTVATGEHMNCLTTTANAVYCWGNNDYGTIGDGTSLTMRASPTRVDALVATQVSLGYRFGCALGVGGGVQCWGRGSVGQLGNNAAISSLSPVDVYDLASGVTDISAGSTHACVVRTDGRLMCWGGNQYGELGNGGSGTYLVKPMYACTNTTSCTPHFTGVAQVSAGMSATCAVKSNGALYCWGSNLYGRLGLGEAETVHTLPQQVTALANVARVAMGDAHVCALTTGGALYCWGSNNVGQLGDGTKQQRNLPVLAIAQGVSDFAVGSSHTCAVLAGSVKCWGGNDYGQLGDSTIDDHSLPSFVVGLADQVTSVSAGTDHSCALLSNGRLQCWGANGDGELGDTGTVQLSPAPVYVVRDF